MDEKSENQEIGHRELSRGLSSTGGSPFSLSPNLNAMFHESSKVEIRGMVFEVIHATTSTVALRFVHFNKRNQLR